MRRHLALAVVVAGALSACGPAAAPNDESSTVGLTPSFPAVSATAGSAVAQTSVAAPATTAPPAAQPVTPAVDPVTPTPPVALPAETTGSFVDGTGDVRASSPDTPPWADLVSARLRRGAEGFELRVELGGGSAPTSSGAGDRTMNLASFYDVDGDGTVDFEVWANLAEGGWGGAWFDDDEATARYVDDSGVAVSIEGAEVVLRFPLGHVGGAERFRWSLASEYGSQALIGTDLAARDDAPDGDIPAAFPQ